MDRELEETRHGVTLNVAGFFEGLRLRRHRRLELRNPGLFSCQPTDDRFHCKYLEKNNVLNG